MLGLAVGDALGWPMEDRGGRVGGTAKVQPAFEFMAWRRREGGRYAPNVEDVAAGSYSDDTQLALAVARSRTLGDSWWDYFVRVELPMWTIYERGGGGATKRAAQSWLDGHPPWEGKDRESVRRYFAAGGNGALMRCLPHCLTPRSRGTNERNYALDRDGLSTHGHPRALLGSRIYGASVAWALERTRPLTYGGLIQRLLETLAEWSEPPDLTLLEGRVADSWEAEWLTTVEEVVHLLHLSLDGLSEGAVAVDRPILQELGAFGQMKGAGTVTAVAAIFLASRYASQPQQGLLAAAFARGADTDTLASLTAALIGALTGPDWLEPLSQSVQDADYIEQVTDAVVEDRALVGAAEPFGRAARGKIYRWLDAAEVRDKGSFNLFGEATVAAISDQRTKTTFVRSWLLLTQSGQSLHVKRYDRDRSGHPRWRTAPETKPGAERREKPRAGLILQVAQLEEARHFYEYVVGLEANKATKDFVSFGWLALEPLPAEQRARQLDLASPDIEEGQAIRVYLSEEAIERARRRADTLGLGVFAPSARFKAPAFRCRDPDGHIVEFVNYNGKPPVIRG